MSLMRAVPQENLDQPTGGVGTVAGVECTQEMIGKAPCRARIALLSNPNSTQNMARLPVIRDYCADQPDIFHYEVDAAEQTSEALKTIARIDPAILIINGGDGTVQAVLTELHNGDAFGDNPPPVAVLPSGKTNLIALDLGAEGGPIEMLGKLQDIVAKGIEPHIVTRELIALSEGEDDDQPIIGMFLGGAGLADIMLYCRHKIYPMGLPNGVSHFLTAIAVVAQQLLGLKGKALPPAPRPTTLGLGTAKAMTERFAVLMVTTLDKLLLNQELASGQKGGLKIVAVEQGRRRVLGALWASIMGKLGKQPVKGVHIEATDRITIAGEASEVILDGESFAAPQGGALVLRTANPIRFVKLAA